jgi:hypothetical protein
MKQWDLFISHASEDKQEVAIPLAEALRRAGMSVWLDVDQLQIGDSIREKIESGLVACQYGVVIVSPNFIAKQWPKRELNALFALEEDGVPLILPVWHNVDRAAVVSYSPILADRLAMNTQSGFDYLAKGISKVVLGNRSSPAVRSPSRARRLLNILDPSTSPQKIKQFLIAQTEILEHALGGGEIAIRSDVSLDVATGDLFLGQRLMTARIWRWHLVMLGKVSGYVSAGSELELIDSQISQIRSWILANPGNAREKLPDIHPDFRATILIGRRASLSTEEAETFRDYNDSVYDAEVRTYDWLVEAALED